MKCDFCDKKATVFLTQLVNGKMTKVKLCEKCAEQKGVTDPAGFSLADFLSGHSPIPMPASEPAASGKPSDPTLKCPSCGFTLEDLQRVRRFGCSECYRTFHDEVTRMLHGMHKGPAHTGKVPEGLVAKQLLSQRVEALRNDLDKAIRDEDYEQAASIRDQIQSLTGLRPSGDPSIKS